MACLRPQRFHGVLFVCLLRSKRGGGEEGASQQRQRCERWVWRACTGRKVQPPLVSIPQRCLPFFVLELTQGREQKRSSIQENRACPGIQITPKLTVAGQTQLSLSNFPPPQTVKGPCLPHPQLITPLSNPSLRECPPTLWIYFTPVLVV